MGIDNDTRGWIMTVVSGIASIICVDLIVRQFPGKKNFKIEESNMFLSCGLSLSFGVMIFSSLYSILPSSKRYLIDGGLSPKIATSAMVGCFLTGAIGISVLSQILHRYIPHKVVDCEHGYNEEEEGKLNGEAQRRSTPQLDESDQEGEGFPPNGSTNDPHSRILARRPSLHAQISSKVSSLLVNGAKEFCDENGNCFGYSDRACGQECFRNVQNGRPSRPGKSATRPLGVRSKSTPHERQPLLEDVDEVSSLGSNTFGPAIMESPVASLTPTNGHAHAHAGHKQSHPYQQRHSHSEESLQSHASSSPTQHDPDGHHHAHHHHVPTNAFLSIGLQTSTAIALHKIPEGFITYATNHANPRLGFSIFLALFIHNISEGFAMALPLYLAINSRWKAMFWSTLLGGVSQPLGAGVAALWFKLAGGKDGAGGPGDTMYGCMFAMTAGIMAMVSLQLLGESLELTHSRRACFASAFFGMGILGLSSALTA
ncbi:Zinc/iron permease [Pleomassaria siparia CBS 279.74]|uniref:Zinc/iron permease n=1 Tax=Pleomassaria siparia CBS 279.74 TaxID=1314801 RepID=A0A6G1KPB8_9PLEO|nr:Zinc/iron permease [Pleomassaria siparia CBS 279.74]